MITVFSGTLQDGGIGGGSGGSLTKTGRGTLTLSGSNTYTGNTIVTQGTLVINNTSGSVTGSGAVQVTRGTLGGAGTVSGDIIIGGGGGQASLFPAAGIHGGLRGKGSITTLGTLTLTGNSRYVYTARAKGVLAKTDKVTASGVTINGSVFEFVLTAQGPLQAGTVLTAIENTAATPIAGNFTNLADGAIITASGNNFQANYEGGDGNDLTLTVVP